MLRKAGFMPRQLATALDEIEERIQNSEVLPRVEVALFGSKPYEFLLGSTRNATPFPNRLFDAAYSDQLGRLFYPCDDGQYADGDVNPIDSPAVVTDLWFFAIPPLLSKRRISDPMGGADYTVDPFTLPRVDEQFWLKAERAPPEQYPFQCTVTVVEVVELREASALVRFSDPLYTFHTQSSRRNDREAFEQALLKCLEQ